MGWTVIGQILTDARLIRCHTRALRAEADVEDEQTVFLKTTVPRRDGDEDRP